MVSLERSNVAGRIDVPRRIAEANNDMRTARHFGAMLLEGIGNGVQFVTTEDEAVKTLLLIN